MSRRVTIPGGLIGFVAELAMLACFLGAVVSTYLAVNP